MRPGSGCHCPSSSRTGSPSGWPGRRGMNEVIKPVLEEAGLDHRRTKFLINPTGRFVIGGPHGDAGLTGRKIIVDTYGGGGSPRGGRFSGGGPTQGDRSA